MKNLLAMVLVFLMATVCFAQEEESAQKAQTRTAPEKKSSNKKTPQKITPDKTVTYKKTRQGELKLHIFLPPDHKASDTRGAIVFFFGGGWVSGKPYQFYEQSEMLAEKGMVAVSAEYRIESVHKTTPFECVRDGKSAVRWLKEHAGEWGIDRNRIVAAGGSAGGHVAACTGTILGFDEEHSNYSSIPSAMVLFNPVIDTTAKGYGARKFKNKKAQLSLSPCHNVRAGLVPTILFHGTGDTTVPHENAERFTKLMKDAGNDCTLKSYKDKGHGFFNGKYFRKKLKDDSDFQSIMKETIQFLTDHGYFEKEVPAPTPAELLKLRQKLKRKATQGGLPDGSAEKLKKNQ